MPFQNCPLPVTWTRTCFATKIVHRGSDGVVIKSPIIVLFNWILSLNGLFSQFLKGKPMFQISKEQYFFIVVVRKVAYEYIRYLSSMSHDIPNLLARNFAKYQSNMYPLLFFPIIFMEYIMIYQALIIIIFHSQ